MKNAPKMRLSGSLKIGSSVFGVSPLGTRAWRRWPLTDLLSLFNSTRDLLHRLPGQPTGAKCRLKIVAADGAVQIEYFASKIQIGAELALHGFGIDFA